MEDINTVDFSGLRITFASPETIIKGIDIPQSSVPESFHVLVKELNALGLSIDYAK